MGRAVQAVTDTVKTLISGPKAIMPPEPPPAPAILEKEPVKVMPTADDDAVKKAKRKKLAAVASRGGRQSTILSRETENDPLGG